MPQPSPRSADLPSAPVLFATAFLEGFAVLLVEIVGARALAPYFGTSLMVWTAQITATLMFLALGYRVGGALSAKPNRWHLPALFCVAGGWLLSYRWLRFPVMGAAASAFSVAGGSFASATALFGVPLLCLGSVSPVVISYLDRRRPGAGSAAGMLFFTNTLGGLAGGWATAFVVIPYFSVSGALASTGLLLWILGTFWAVRGRSTAALLAVGAAVAAIVAGSTPATTGGSGEFDVLYDRETSIGRLEVVDYPAGRRGLLIDGIHQGVVDIDSGASILHFPRNLDALSRGFRPGARDALILGLGAGSLARVLAQRGVAVTAVELEPGVVEVARRYFDLPPSVRVEIADARPFLRASAERYDLVFLDVFAGENAPWYLTTVEALAEMRARMRDGGVLLINTVTSGDGQSLGLARLEAAVLAVFPQAIVFLGERRPARELNNATLVAGSHLALDAALADAPSAQILDLLARQQRAATSRVAPGSDDWNDLDYTDVPLRAQWRQIVLREAQERSRP